MKKALVLALAVSACSLSFASRLTTHLHQTEALQRQQEQREWRSDMNFNDLAFRLQRRYRTEEGQRCRDYQFRSKSNPYRSGHYHICEDEGRVHSHR